MMITATDEGDGIRLTFDHTHEIDTRAYKVSYQTLRALVAEALMIPGMQWRIGDPPLGRTDDP